MNFCNFNSIFYSPEFERSDKGEKKEKETLISSMYHLILEVSDYSLLFLFLELTQMSDCRVISWFCAS